MSSAGSATNWITQLKVGDRAGPQQLWGRYFARLVSLSRKQLQNIPRREADEEHVALSVRYLLPRFPDSLFDDIQADFYLRRRRLSLPPRRT
jgi:hypothetical protein